MKSLLIAIALMGSTLLNANAVPNELTRQFCSSMKVMAKQVKEGRELGMTQNYYLEMIAKNKFTSSDTRNIEQVTRISEAVIKGAWLSDDDPESYSIFVHETCLETVVLVP